MEELISLFALLVTLVIEPRTGVLMAMLLMAATIDFRTMKIPNWLTLSGTVFGLLYNTLHPFAPGAGFLWALGGLSLGLAIMLPLYLLKAMGAGDVKLMAMVGAFIGAPAIFTAVLFSVAAGGIAAVVFAVNRKMFGAMADNIKEAAQAMVLSAMAGSRPDLQISAGRSVGKLPFGVSICTGTICYLVAKQLGYL